MSSQITTASKYTDYRVAQAIRQIKGKYGDTVSIEAFGLKLIRSGSNLDVDTTTEQVWRLGGIENHPTSGNPIDTISSSSASDTGPVLIEGHTRSGNELTFIIQSKTLDGQNKVLLDTPLYRGTFLENDGSVDFVGDVYGYQDQAIIAGVPQTASLTHLKAEIGENQSGKAGTSIGNVEYWIMTQLQFAVGRKQIRSVDFSFQIREFNKTWKTHWPCSISSEMGTFVVDLDPCIIVPKNADCRVLATSSGPGTEVTSILSGYLALITA